MTSKIDDLKDKIFDLEMELKELYWHRDIWWKMIDEDGVDFLYNNEEHVEKLIEENQCWLAYYKQELLYLQNTEKYDE